MFVFVYAFGFCKNTSTWESCYEQQKWFETDRALKPAWKGDRWPTHHHMCVLRGKKSTVWPIPGPEGSPSEPRPPPTPSPHNTDRWLLSEWAAPTPPLKKNALEGNAEHPALTGLGLSPVWSDGWQIGLPLRFRLPASPKSFHGQHGKKTKEKRGHADSTQSLWQGQHPSHLAAGGSSKTWQRLSPVNHVQAPLEKRAPKQSEDKRPPGAQHVLSFDNSTACIL